MRSRRSKIRNQKSKITTDLYRLREAARRAEITVQQLQYYLMVGLISPTVMSDGNQRLFDDRAVQKIRMIHLLNRGGYPLREIRDIFIRPRRSRVAKS